MFGIIQGLYIVREDEEAEEEHQIEMQRARQRNRSRQNERRRQSSSNANQEDPVRMDVTDEENMMEITETEQDKEKGI